MLILLPIVITYIFEFVRNSPNDVHYYKSLLVPSNYLCIRDIGFNHKIEGGIWPFVGSAIFDYNGKDAIYIGGGKGQNDVLLLYDRKTKAFTNVIKDTGLQKQDMEDATYCAVAFDFTNNGLDDLLVGRTSNITLYKQIVNTKHKTYNPKFNRLVIFEHYDRVPLSLTISDYNKNGLADIYISYFTLSKNYKGTIFNDPTHHKQNVLLENISVDNKLKFKDVTLKTKSGGLYNTFTSAFVDLDNRGLPDIVLSHDSGEVEILKNINGKQFESVIPFDQKGNWMGLAIGDINNNGKQDLFLTNIGSDISRDRLSLGDVEESQKQAFGHVLLQNNGKYKFTDITKKAGVSGNGFGWGSLMADFDLDGNNDLIFGENFLLNPLHWIFPNGGHYYTNKNGKFTRTYKFKNHNFAQTPLIADVNSNGLMDLIWINVYGKSYVHFGTNPNNNFINVKLPKTAEFCNAKIIVDTGKQKYYKEIIHGGVGFGCGSTPTLTFGLGKTANIANISIKTIHNKKYSLKSPDINKTLYLIDFTLV